MMTRIAVIVGAVVVIAAVIWAMIAFGGTDSTKTTSSPSPSTKVSTEKCPVTPGSNDVTQLQSSDEVVGTGAEALASSTVTVKYTGCLSDGTVFDSTTKQGGQPVSFALSQVIQGWQQGIPGMKVGGKRTLVIPPALGYGAQATGSIPANSVLTFEVELVAVK